MTKALLLLVWVPFLSLSSPKLIPTNYPVSISCDVTLELMDIVKNDDVVSQRREDYLLLELRRDFIKVC